MTAVPQRRICARSVGDTTGLAAEPSVLLRRILRARGVAEHSSRGTSMDLLLPVRSLDGVEAAADLLRAHRERSILVVGDFDCDGATSTALMLRALRSWGFAAVDFLVPDRFRFGYGLTPGIVEMAAGRSPTLLVTVDNGISSGEGVARARALGMQVLITDHHLPGRDLPAADIIVNPNLPGSGFASRALAGVGVAFYVLAALQRQLQAAGQMPAGGIAVTDLLDLVALGTVADLVPLDANNRILVAQGLRRIRAGRCVPGVRALLELAKRNCDELVASDLGFAVAPRLNAAGRLDDMSVGIRCLLADSVQEATQLAMSLDDLNRQRREIEGEMQQTALLAVRGLAQIVDSDRHQGLCLFDDGWHQGVVGLVASRIKDRVGRPVVAFAPAGDGIMLRGSARSIQGVHIRDVLEAIATREPQLVTRFGGHAMAAGLTIEASQLDRFARAFESEVAAWIRRMDAEDVIWTDGELGEAEISLDNARLLREAGPWGQAFPEPSFHGDFDIESARTIGERHVKFWLRPVDSRARFDAVAFNLLDGEQFAGPPSGRARMVYRLDVNQYGGERRLQLLIDHVRMT